MNLLNFFPNSTADQDFPGTGPQIDFFTIFDPSIQSDKDPESNEAIREKILVYIGFGTSQHSENNIVRRIGFLQGLGDFTTKFGTTRCQVNHVETDKSRILMGSFEGRYQFACGITLGRGKDHKYTRLGLAAPDYLINEFMLGYRLWYLNNGSLDRFVHHDDYKLRLEFLTNWWKNWITNRFETPSSFDYNDCGVLNLLPGIRYSSINLVNGSSLDENVRKLVQSHEDLVDLIVFNKNKSPIDDYGVVYVSEQTPFEFESIKYLTGWLEYLDVNFGLSRTALRSQNLASLKEHHDQNPVIPEQPVNTWSGSIRTTFSTFMSYMPTPKADTENIQPQSSINGSYLLGDIGNGEIYNRKVFLKLKKESQENSFNLIIYQINGFLFVLIFDKDTQLTKKEYYSTLSASLNQIYGDLKYINTDQKFIFLSYDKNRFKTSFPWILDSNKNQVITLHANALNILFNSPELKGLETVERIIKISQQWWALILKRNGVVTLILKRMGTQLIGFNGSKSVSAFGTNVMEWVESQKW